MAARTLEGGVGQVLGGRVAKHGNTDEECQDASDVHTVPDGRVRIALADGATQGSGQALWAGLLAKAAARCSPARAPTLREWLAPIRQEWSRLRAEAPVSPNAPWFVSQTRFRGAGSTLLCVELERRGESLRWSAAAVGDSCVQIVSRSERRLVRSFPVERAEDFGVRPELLYTDSETEVAALLVAEGELAPGDLLITATDAMAKGLLADPRIVEEITDLDNEEAVVAFLQRLKQGDRVEDDDLTVVLFRTAPPPPPPVRTQAAERQRTPRQSNKIAQPVAPASSSPELGVADADERATPGRRATAQTRGDPDNGNERIRTRGGRQSDILQNALVTIFILILHDLGWYILCRPAQEVAQAREVAPVSPREAVASTRNPGDTAIEVRQSAPPAAPPAPVASSGSATAVQPPTTVGEKAVGASEKNTSGASMKPEAVLEAESWMCCDAGCVIKDSVVVVTAENLNKRDSNGETNGRVKSGSYEKLGERIGDRPPAWKDGPDCKQWVRLGAVKELEPAGGEQLAKHEKGSVYARP